MIPKQNRTPRPEIRNLFRRSNRIHSDDLLLLTAQNELPISRFAIIVSKKVARLAVDRNRSKRLIREALHHILPTIKPGIDCIIITQSNFAKQKEVDIEKEIKALLYKIR